MDGDKMKAEAERIQARIADLLSDAGATIESKPEPYPMQAKGVETPTGGLALVPGGVWVIPLDVSREGRSRTVNSKVMWEQDPESGDLVETLWVGPHRIGQHPAIEKVNISEPLAAAEIVKHL